MVEKENMTNQFLDGQRILIVDDEPDVLDTLSDLLHMCEVVKATTFEEAKKQLKSQSFDITILDIMGVRGFELLEIANEKMIIPVMLTAHGLSPENIVKSYKGGAASYLPKEELINITSFLEDILKAKAKGKDPWWRWLFRLAYYWRKEFGEDWQKHEEKFWKEFNKKF